MVAGPGGDARIWKIELGRDRGDDRLRAVAAGHRQPVGAAGHGIADELLEVSPPRQLDRLDPARPRLVRELEPLGLPSAGLRVEEEHGCAGGAASGSATRVTEGGLGRGEGAERRRPDEDRLEDAAVEDDDQHAASTSSAAQLTPATRAMPRRISPYHAATAAPISRAARISPRGNSLIDRVGGGTERQPAQSDRQDRRQRPRACRHQTSVSAVIRPDSAASRTAA